MKKYVLIGILVVVVILCFILLFVRGRKEKKVIDSIKELNYSSSNGRSRIEFKLQCDDSCTLTAIPSWMDDEEGVSVSIEDNIVDQILRILQNNDVASWDGFSKSDSHVLDGNDFTFKVVTKNNQSIYAHGYMKFPKNYKEVITELEKIFNNLFDQSFSPLFEHESLKGFSIDDVSKLETIRYTEGGEEVEEEENLEKIQTVYNRWKDVLIMKECPRACDDNTTIYRFTMKDGTNYQIEKECNWIVLDRKRYYYKEYPFS